MVSPKKDAVAVMDGLAVASMFDALVHTDRGGPEPGGPEPTGTPSGPVSGLLITRTKFGNPVHCGTPMRVGFRGGREDRAGERASTGIGGLGRPRDHVRPLTSLAAR